MTDRNAPPTCEELADAAAFIAWRDNPTDENAMAWQRAWFAATGGKPIHTTSRCQACGLHRTGRYPDEGCRACGAMYQRVKQG